MFPTRLHKTTSMPSVAEVAHAMSPADCAALSDMLPNGQCGELTNKLETCTKFRVGATPCIVVGTVCKRGARECVVVDGEARAHPPPSIRLSDEEVLKATLGSLYGRDQFRVPLHKCDVIMPAATGTRATYSLFNLLRSTTQGLAAKYMLHTHDYRAVESKDAFNGRRCFVMSIREPAARLASAVRHDFVNPECHRPTNRGIKTHCLQYVLYANGTGSFLGRYLHTLRDRTDPVRHAEAVAKWEKLRKEWYMYFLREQVQYLHGAADRQPTPCSHANATEFHFLCTPTLLEDFRALLASTRAFESARASSAARTVFMEAIAAEHRLGSNHHREGDDLEDRVRLSSEDADFVNRELYPLDFELYRRICGAYELAHESETNLNRRTATSGGTSTESLASRDGRQQGWGTGRWARSVVLPHSGCSK